MAALVSVRNLIAGVTRDGALTGLLEILGDLGFTTTAWQPGSVQRTMVTALAWAIADASETVSEIAANALDPDASGDWLDVVSRFYGHTRVPATRAVGLITLTSASGSPTHTITAGVPVVTENADGSGQQYYITSGGTLTANTTQTFTLEAAAAGAAGNIPTGTVYLTTPLAGVTATLVADPTTGTWVTTAGTDEESDSRLRERNALKWSELSYGAQPDAYGLWMLESDPSITRWSVANDGAGGVTVRGATSAGGITAGQISAAQAYIDERKPFGDAVTVATATPKSITITAAPTLTSGLGTVADIQAAITEYFASVPLGGEIVPPSSSGQVLRDEIIDRIMSIPGVTRADLSTPATDVSLGANEIPVASYAITPLVVS